MSEQHSQPRVARTSETIIGPAKWFAAGGITIGAAVGLVFAFMNASPRALPPLLNSEAVALAPTATQPADSPHASAAPIAVPSLTTTTTGPARPLSSTTEALLVPRTNVASPASLMPTAPNATPPAATPPRDVESPKVEPAPTVPMVAPQTPPQPSVNPSNPAKPPSPKPATPQPQSPAIAGGTINLNTATASELELLPQIGPALAARIIDYRTTHGPFRQLADLDKVKGIGPKTLDKLKGLVRFE